MEHSKAYEYLYKQFNAIGKAKGDGYYSMTMEEIYDWEREEVEEVIWETFPRDRDLAIFLPKLKKYDGVKALKEELLKCTIPSHDSAVIAHVLYEHTGDEKYIDVIKQNIDKAKYKQIYVGMLLYCKPCKKVYDLLVEIYLKSNDELIEYTAVMGILYNKGVVTHPSNALEYKRNEELMRKFHVKNKDERKKIIERFENGEL